MSLTELAGYAGAGLAGAAYIPQISHMVRERCVAGISRRAFVVWLVASTLVLVRAVAAREVPFVALGVVQTTATGFIAGYVSVHAGRYCSWHAPTGHAGGADLREPARARSCRRGPDWG